jgi:hypothetical protein
VRPIRAIKRAIKKAFNRGIHHDTIDAVAKREKIAIDTLKRKRLRASEPLVLVTRGVSEPKCCLEKGFEARKPGELAMIPHGVAFDKPPLRAGLVGATHADARTESTRRRADEGRPREPSRLGGGLEAT